jgi:hypothetical protein
VVGGAEVVLMLEDEDLLTRAALEELGAKLRDELPEVEIPKAEIVRDVAEPDETKTSISHRANGYVVPKTTVLAAARSLT